MFVFAVRSGNHVSDWIVLIPRFAAAKSYLSSDASSVVIEKTILLSAFVSNRYELPRFCPPLQFYFVAPGIDSVEQAPTRSISETGSLIGFVRNLDYVSATIII